ncbi:hypothetical protein IWQ60_000332 [Tieghemiomyces parasiticus]|uniref:Protein PNS1 n=1 Tax=Tieghemiomyces parasiticus TaxID=78921 RepID=A0A9W8AJ25_9FUNG|nr:hypothetical protein IWQ60_000332 [Tieghemiomyces parasiticus]
MPLTPYGPLASVLLNSQVPSTTAPPKPSPWPAESDSNERTTFFSTLAEPAGSSSFKPVGLLGSQFPGRPHGKDPEEVAPLLPVAPSRLGVSQLTNLETATSLESGEEPVPNQATHLKRLHGTRRAFDQGFLVAYTLSLAVFLLTGLYIYFTTEVPTLDPGHTNPLFSNLNQAVGLIFLLVVISTGLGILWLVFLKHYAEQLIWTTVILVPLVSFATSLAILTFAVTRAPARGTIAFETSYLVGALVSFAIGVFQAFYIARRKEQIERSMRAIHLALNMLSSHPELFALAILLLSGYVLFLVVWLIFFSRLALLVPSFPNLPSSLTAPVVLIASFYCFIFTWTTGVFTNLLRITITMVTAQWYFYRHEDERLGITHSTQAAFHLIVKEFMGSVCLGGLVLAFAQILSGITHYTLLILRPFRIFPFTFVAFLFRLLEKVTETLSSFSIVYVGVTGKSFFTSAYAVTNLMKRNYVFSIRSALIVGNLLSVTSTSFALATGWALSYISLADLGMDYPYLPGVFGVATSWVIFQFFGHILVNTVEAALVCYAVDLDAKTLHSNEAQRAFVAG